MYDPSSITAIAMDTVTSKIESLDQMANKYSSMLSNSLSEISEIKVADVPDPERLVVETVEAPVVDWEGLPEFTPPNLKMAAKPDGAEIDDLLRDLRVDDQSDPMEPEAFVPREIVEPGERVITAPARPDIDPNVNLPDAPNPVMPDMEALERITIPEFEFPILPTFDDKPPSADEIAVPDVFINWSEPQYQSEVLSDLVAQVRGMMAGGTGLPPAIEDALFSRARERVSVETEMAAQEAFETWAARDFSMPPGMLVKAVNIAREAGQVRAAELNRDILVEAAKWEIENLRFAVGQGMALEQLTQNLFSNTVNRLFEVAKFKAEAEIRVFDARITLFNAQNEAFNTLANVFKTKLDAALSYLQAYKLAIDGQVAKGQINQQYVDVYKAKLDGVQSQVEIYKAMMQGASVRADVIKSQFDAYRTDIQAYAEELGAEKTKFDIYETKVKAEQVRAGAYDTQARAYASTVQALSNKADMRVKQIQVRMEAARVKLQKYQADTDMYKAETQANMTELQHYSQAFTAQVDAWRAGATADVANAEMQSRFADMNTRTSIAYSEMQISEFQARLQHAIQEAQIALESSKALGQYTAQLAAGAMSAAHVSASIGASGSHSSSDSKSQSESTSTSHSYNY